VYTIGLRPVSWRCPVQPGVRPQRQLGRVQAPGVLKMQDRWQISRSSQRACHVAEGIGLRGPSGGDLGWGHPARPGEVAGAPDQADTASRDKI
jgi:hypothetical protein